MNGNNFKVGDWVVGKHNKNPIHIKNIGTTPTNSSVTINGTFSVDQFTLWQPKEGERCWFWNNEKDLTLQKFWKSEKGYFIVAFCEKTKSDGLVFYEVTDKHFKNCEPFIGKLPSFLKES